MNGLRHIPAGLSSLWGQVRYRWLPLVVFATLIAGVAAVWHYAFVPAEIILQPQSSSSAYTSSNRSKITMPCAAREHGTNKTIPLR